MERIGENQKQTSVLRMLGRTLTVPILTLALALRKPAVADGRKHSIRCGGDVTLTMYKSISKLVFSDEVLILSDPHPNGGKRADGNSTRHKMSPWNVATTIDCAYANRYIISIINRSARGTATSWT